MGSTHFSGDGKTVQLGKELGKGGEGSVFEVDGNAQLVAKIYNHHHTPDAAKQAKLKFMAKTADSELLNYAAWPTSTLHKTRDSGAIGFLMPRVNGRVPIHMLYSPAHRKQDYPKVAWDFLIWVARNTAAAFSTIHKHGHVLGDVNQGNVLVGADSKVVLIDTDSFQINTGDKTHLCTVGVAHFTPPELQGSTSFDVAARSPNHDNFGLALLIFHLLFGGRHPYSGVPLTKNAGESLEGDIQAFRFAYAKDSKNRGFDPPPRSIPLSVVPEKMQHMFYSSFTESGVRGGRPTSQQWVTALDELRGNLVRCNSSKMHIFSKHVPNCPWCHLERQGLVLFLDLNISTTVKGNTTFVLERVWAAIQAESPPQQLAIPTPSSVSVKPRPLPPKANQHNSHIFKRLGVVLAGITIGAVSPAEYWILLIIAGIFVVFSIKPIENKELQIEKNAREYEKNLAQKEYDDIVNRVKAQSGHEVFAKKKAELTPLREEYLRLPELERAELEKLRSSAESRQKQKYLERFFIDQADIPGVGQAKKAALRSFGIETAADVSWQSVYRVKGFGDRLTAVVTAWRQQCEKGFRFNPSKAITDSEKMAVRNKVARRKLELESHLVGGLEELRRIKANSVGQAKVLGHLMEKANHKLAQALADSNIVR